MGTRSEVGASTSKVRKSYFPPQSERGNTLDGERSERANALYMSRAGYISSLTRIRSDIENHLKFNGKLDQIDKMLETYEKTWHDFVDTHEKYLDNIDGVKVREAALYVYSEQFKLKHEFDYFIKLEEKEEILV